MAAATQHHSGILTRVFTAFRTIYHKGYVPWLVWLGNKMGGRTRAGRLGRASRVTRLLGNLLTLTAIVAIIATVGVTAFWTGGAALPVWAAILVAAGITINSVGVIIGAAANHLKIEQYYDAELELHTSNNQLKPEGSKTELPHGFHAPARKLFMSGLRYTHDMNGAAGTVTGWAATLLETMSWLSAGLITFEPLIGSALFIAARASALISATGAVGTNQHRLWVYKKSIAEKITEYYQLKESANREKHHYIIQLISETFISLNIQENHQYTSWVGLRCYKALDAAMTKPLSLNEGNKVKLALSVTLQHYLKDESSSWQKWLVNCVSQTASPVKKRFSRHALMNMASAVRAKLSVLDSMPLLEHTLFEAITMKVNALNCPTMSQAVDKFSASYLAIEKDPAISLFLAHLKQALIKHALTAITAFDIYSLFINNFAHFFIEVQVGKCYQYILNKKTLLEYYPLLGNPHGNQFLVDYHTKEIAYAIVQRLKQLKFNKNTSSFTAAFDVSAQLQQQNNTSALKVSPPGQHCTQSTAFLPDPRLDYCPQ